MSERPAVLAADLALCHPPLAPDEVRAVARPMEAPSTFRVTVVATDRPGLLADTAAALAEEDMTVRLGVRGDVDRSGHRPALAHGRLDDGGRSALGCPR